MNEEKLTEELIKHALSYADDLTRPPLKQIGGIFADTVTYWRYKNQINIILKAEEFHKKKGITPRTIPVKTLGCLLNFSSIEEDNTLKEMWAKLVANSTDSSNNFNNHFILANLLKELSPDEAIVLKYFWVMSFINEINNKRIFKSHRKSSILEKSFNYINRTDKNIEYGTDAYYERENIVIENLLRLNLVRYKKSKIEEKNRYSGLDYKTYEIKESDEIELTTLGRKLVIECNID